MAGTLIDIQPLKDLHTFQLELETKVQERTAEMEELLKASQQQAAELKEQQRVQEAIQAEMARTQIELTGQMAALNNAAIVSEVDTRGYILAVNDEFCRMAKYTREELLGQKQGALIN